MVRFRLVLTRPVLAARTGPVTRTVSFGSPVVLPASILVTRPSKAHGREFPMT
jgi:hypothetical protein